MPCDHDMPFFFVRQLALTVSLLCSSCCCFFGGRCEHTAALCYQHSGWSLLTCSRQYLAGGCVVLFRRAAPHAATPWFHHVDMFAVAVRRLSSTANAFVPRSDHVAVPVAGGLVPLGSLAMVDVCGDDYGRDRRRLDVNREH
ncbi:hypothetical protein AVEN_33399-1 [Araneus ventricosus]|uniref:Secreted protein n=1 Tax=Araneus ventricosus TaxID=182803 RepID=A0A4Y2ANX4_ARAVE|nr:hypothetical protein AVEN_33399-1 [Araneus ventricosus]